MNILIVGLGSIGKRHLESILNHKTKLNLYLYDLKNFNYGYSKNNHIIKKIDKLPNKECFDLVIISTTSIDRYKILKSLISRNQINNILIEKVAFLKIDNYKKALTIKNVFINYPRPLMNSYICLKNFIKNKKLNSLTVHGNGWNMLSNSLHFLNLFSFLTDRPLTKINSFKIHNRKYRSKRNYFDEIKGEILFTNNFNQSLKLIDKPNNQINFLEIKLKNYLINVYENKSFIEIIDQNNQIINKEIFKVEYQSDLTIEYLSKLNNKKFQYMNLKKNIKNEILYLDFINQLKLSNKKIFNNLIYT